MAERPEPFRLHLDGDFAGGMQRAAEAAATARWVGIPVAHLPTEEHRNPLPQYRTPSGRIAKIAGAAADSWPHPREFQSEDGALFVERPMPHESGWGITFHTSWKKTWLGHFLAHYVEGRASGFPFWPSIHFSARDTLLHRILKRPAGGA